METKYYIECGETDSKIRIEYGFIDPGMDDWKVAFKSILTFLTFHPDLIEKIIKEDFEL